MNSEKEKIQGIVKEFVANSLNAKAGDINVTIKAGNDKTTITVRDDGMGMDERTLEDVRKLLNQPRRDELEEYYGGLAGNSKTALGLNIVGMLVDQTEVESIEGQGTTITVIRYRNNSPSL